MVAQIVALWVAVTNAGGAVGFAEGVTPDEVRTLSEPALKRVSEGVDDLVVAEIDGRIVGLGFLATNELDIHSHWGTVKRLQRHPDVRESGVGAALLQGLEEAAAARGLQRLVLTVRGGTGREGFYAHHGFRLEATLPARIKLDEHDIREEHVMGKAIGSSEAGLRLQIHRLDPELPLPAYAHPGDAGLDLYARESVRLEPGERAVVPTGVAIALPRGCVGLVHPRSGLAARVGLSLVNTPGTIDEGYRGEVKVIAINLDPTSALEIARGERIAQLVVQRVENVEVVEVATLGDTSRGSGGFGSSGQ